MLTAPKPASYPVSLCSQTVEAAHRCPSLPPRPNPTTVTCSSESRQRAVRRLKLLRRWGIDWYCVELCAASGMCDPPLWHGICFPAAPGSPHLHQSPSSPAPTKTRSTSSQRARRSAPSNSPAPCTSPRPLSPRRTRTTRRRASSQSLRGPRCSTAPPLRSPRAPAQTTPRRSPARPQRLQIPRQTARPSARPEQSWPLAPGSTLATTDHHHWLSHRHLPLLCQGSLRLSVLTPSTPPYLCMT